MTDQTDLPTIWRQRAELLRKYGARDQAGTLETCADKLKHLGYGAADEILTLKDASEWSGYSPSRLRALIRDAKLENVSTNSRIRLRRGDQESHDAARYTPPPMSSVPRPSWLRFIS